MSNDKSGSRLPATLGCRYSGRDVDMWTTRCYKFIQISVIAMLLGNIGHEAGGMFARQRPHIAMCQSDFCCAVLCGVVTQQQYDFFHEYRYLQVTSTTGNLVNTAKAEP